MAEIVGVNTAAVALGVHPNTVRNWTKDGLLTDVRVPGSAFARYDLDEVRALASHRKDPAAIRVQYAVVSADGHQVSEAVGSLADAQYARESIRRAGVRGDLDTLRIASRTVTPWVSVAEGD